MELIGEVGRWRARAELIVAIWSRGPRRVLASSAKEDEVDHYLDLLDAREIVDDWTTSADVEATKPEPDLVEAALDKVGAEDGVMVGDTPWDVDGGEAGGAGDARRADRRLLGGRAARRGRGRGLRVGASSCARASASALAGLELLADLAREHEADVLVDGPQARRRPRRRARGTARPAARPAPRERWLRR